MTYQQIREVFLASNVPGIVPVLYLFLPGSHPCKDWTWWCSVKIHFSFSDLKSTSRDVWGFSLCLKEAQFNLGLGRGGASVNVINPEITWEARTQPLTRVTINQGELWKGLMNLCRFQAPQWISTRCSWDQCLRLLMAGAEAPLG